MCTYTQLKSASMNAIKKHLLQLYQVFDIYFFGVASASRS